MSLFRYNPPPGLEVPYGAWNAAVMVAPFWVVVALLLVWCAP